MKKQSEYQKKYDSNHRKFYGLNLNLETDADIISKLEKAESVQGYIKQAIRAYIRQTEKESK